MYFTAGPRVRTVNDDGFFGVIKAQAPNVAVAAFVEGLFSFAICIHPDSIDLQMPCSVVMTRPEENFSSIYGASSGRDRVDALALKHISRSC
jgi:hypothetical protein